MKLSRKTTMLLNPISMFTDKIQWNPKDNKKIFGKKFEKFFSNFKTDKDYIHLMGYCDGVSVFVTKTGKGYLEIDRKRYKDAKSIVYDGKEYPANQYYEIIGLPKQKRRCYKLYTIAEQFKLI